MGSALSLRTIRSTGVVLPRRGCEHSSPAITGSFRTFIVDVPYVSSSKPQALVMIGSTRSYEKCAAAITVNPQSPTTLFGRNNSRGFQHQKHPRQKNTKHGGQEQQSTLDLIRGPVVCCHVFVGEECLELIHNGLDHG